MKKRILALLLCALMVCTLLPVNSSAEEMMAYIASYDLFVYAGGVYDMVAETNITGAKYLWCARYGMDGTFFGLSDNEGYSGTATSHLRLKTSDGLAMGTGWENIQFACMITAPDGRIRMTEPRTMTIYGTEKLVQDMAALNLKITDLSLDGLTPKYDSYYDVPAGAPLRLHATIPTLDSRYEQSEMRLGIKCSLLEKFEPILEISPGDTFSLEKISQIYVVRASLVLYINDVEALTLDMKQFNVHTYTPNWQSEATVKTAGSLYASPNAAAKRLTSLSAGQMAYLVENNGSWCKIASGGYVGYARTSSLTLKNSVSQVSIHTQEPVYDVPVNLEATVEGEGYKLYRNDPVMWYDRTAQRFLTNGDVFLKNHTYTLQVWLEAENGSVFLVDAGNHCAVSGTINGVAATVNTAYEQDPKQVVEISSTFSHVHDPKKVTQVNPTCTIAGKLTYYHCACGADFADNRGLERITDIDSWGTLPARGHWASPWQTNGTEHYQYCQRRECGVIIPGTRGTHTGGTADCHSQAVCTVCNLPYGELGSHIWSSQWDYSDASGHAHRCTSLLCSEHSAIQPHRPGPAATESSPQTCLDCGYELAPVTADNPFVDVIPGKYYYSPVLWAYYHTPQVTKGVDATHFAPEDTCTRAQVVTFLWRAKGCPEPAMKQSPYKDVTNPDSYYYKAVLWAVENKITLGTSSNTFSPNDGCTRGQVVTFLWRTEGEPAPASTSNPFTDVKAGEYYEDAVLWAYYHSPQITNGTSGDKFSPNTTCTRGQIVTFLYRDLG